mmetsp:Transcript_52723/g.97603  ORF Transcript_52723/g.97603 Transcript_52723/m.97603 type:complete len:91 (-) Transcript_52723:238-510(-)
MATRSTSRKCALSTSTPTNSTDITNACVYESAAHALVVVVVEDEEVVCPDDDTSEEVVTVVEVWVDVALLMLLAVVLLPEVVGLVNVELL